MMTFEYRDWEEDFLDMIESELSKRTIEFDCVEDAEDKVHELLLHDIDNACIYYKDCFAIVVGLWVTHWDELLVFIILGCKFKRDCKMGFSLGQCKSFTS